MNNKKIIKCWEEIKKTARHNDDLVPIGTSDDNSTRMIYPYGEPLFTEKAVFLPCKLRKYRHDVEGYMCIDMDMPIMWEEEFPCHKLIAELIFYSFEEFEKLTKLPSDIYKRLQN